MAWLQPRKSLHRGWQTSSVKSQGKDRSAFPKRNKDGRNFQKARSQSGHCNCQSVTFPPSLLVQTLERGTPLGCSVSQHCCPYLVLLQCRHLFFPLSETGK